jgi:hypothetical protein
MSKFQPIEIVLEVNSAQLSVLEDIHEVLEYVSKKLNRCLPKSFSKNGDDTVQRTIELVENLEYERKLWVLEEFKAKMNSHEVFKGVGIQRINPRSYEEE